MNKLPAILGKLPPRFQFTLHNIVGHPLSEVLFQVGLEKASAAVHDLTFPTPVHYRFCRPCGTWHDGLCPGFVAQ